MKQFQQRTLIAEEQVQNAFRRGRQFIEVKPGAIVTAQAQDTAARLNIKLLDNPPKRAAVVRTGGSTATRRILYRNNPSWEPPARLVARKRQIIEKLALVGAGGVGASLAHLAANSSIAKEITLIDILPGAAEAVALDLQHASGITRSTARLKGSTSLKSISQAQVIVVTAGRPRTPGMDRSDLSYINGRIIRSIGETIADLAPDSVVITVTNPVEEMTLLMLRTTGFSRERVIGMAGTLDSARFRRAIAQAADVAVTDVEAMTLGSHGNEMVPLVSRVRIRDRSIREFLNESAIESCQTETVEGGASVVKLRRTGSATLAPAHATLEILEYMTGARAGIVPVSVLLSGEYGLDAIVIGVPCKLSMSGVFEIVELDLEDEELASLQGAAHAVRARIEAN